VAVPRRCDPRTSFAIGATDVVPPSFARTGGWPRAWVQSTLHPPDFLVRKNRSHSQDCTLFSPNAQQLNK
jgi:hypothetical protein